MQKAAQSGNSFLLPFSPLHLCKGPHRYHALANSQEASHRLHFAPRLLWLSQSCLLTCLSPSPLFPSPAASQSTSDYCLLSHECCLHWEKKETVIFVAVGTNKSLFQDSNNSSHPKASSGKQRHWLQSALKINTGSLSLQRRGAHRIQKNPFWKNPSWNLYSKKNRSFCSSHSSFSLNFSVPR